MSPEVFEFVVGVGDPTARLDTLVVELLLRGGLTVSRSSVRSWISHERVLVDGRPAKPSVRVRVGANIRVSPEPAPPTDALPDASVEVPVLYQDDHLLVVDKPAGLVVHPARGHATGTLVNGLLALGVFDQHAEDSEDPDAKTRPGIVHRLDKDTSGVMVVARTEVAREGLKALFSKHDINREYVAVVVGKARDGTYDTPYGRHPVDRLRFSTRTRGECKRAVTHVRVLERFANDALGLVVCTLGTGRTHQIRVHLSECGGTPILGDPLYGGRVRDPFVAGLAKELGRQWLHARLLGFVHPVTLERMRFESPLPRDLETVVHALRSKG